MVHHWPKELLIWHSTVLSLGQMAQLIMVILSLTALIDSRCIPNGTYTDHYWANLAHSLKCTKNSICTAYFPVSVVLVSH